MATVDSQQSHEHHTRHDGFHFGFRLRALLLLTILAIAGFLYVLPSPQSSQISGEQEWAEAKDPCDDPAMASTEDLSADCVQSLALASNISTATLGDSTTVYPLSWPILANEWPGADPNMYPNNPNKTLPTGAMTPIENCDLLYSSRTPNDPLDNKTVSTGFQIMLSRRTAVYAVADGVVQYSASGMMTLKIILANGKVLYANYQNLKERNFEAGKTVKRGQEIAVAGPADPNKVNLDTDSLHFGVWNVAGYADGKPLGGRPNIDTQKFDATSLLSKIEHPLNYLPLDGRNVNNCKPVRPVNGYTKPTVPGSTTQTPASFTWPIAKQDWATTVALPITECNLFLTVSPTQENTVHTGIHIVANGKPVYAATNGKVVYADNGTYIIQVTDALKSKRNGKPLYLDYENLASLSYKAGQQVAKGQKIGTTPKNTPSSIGYLHFGVWTTSKLLTSGVTSRFTQAGKDLYAQIEHPLNYLPNDGRKTNECPTAPYGVPETRGPDGLIGPAASSTWNSGKKAPYILEEYAIEVLQNIAYKKGVDPARTVTPEHIIALVAFMLGEGGDINNKYLFNPLNTGLNAPELIDGTPKADGTQSFKSFNAGVEATARTMLRPKQSRLGTILIDPKSDAGDFMYALTYFDHYAGNAFWAEASIRDPAYPKRTQKQQQAVYYTERLRLVSRVRRDYANVAGLVIGTNVKEYPAHITRKDLLRYGP